MTPEQFKDLARQGYNRIPVSREVIADSIETVAFSLINVCKVAGGGGARLSLWKC